ncbi:hypothetical protein PBY51_021870 [Eleginops maclovinus]|uniref:Uncharacterized protein n=1 Tax=Eleginops maclovinus TaxID=56733 RepID=A0AAN7XHL1_ELEMC|nr:hypothetical protein PBY51_021870 [Eleginops maclovinus]
MAASRYFPSIHDMRADNKSIWTHLDLRPEQLNLLTISFTEAFLNKGCKVGASKKTSTTLQDEANAASMKCSSLAVSDYQPLDFFSSTAVEHGSTTWSEEDEMCEINIRLKEIELGNMMGEPGVLETTGQRILGHRSKKPVGNTRRHF